MSVQSSIKSLVLGSFFLQLLNASFNLILNIYLRKNNYSDATIADFTSYRFISILLFSIPFGLIIKGKRLKPFFITGSLIVPLSGAAMLLAANAQMPALIRVCFFAGSIGFMLVHVTALPFILRHSDEETLSESIALNFVVWSLASIVSGFMINLLFNLAGRFPGLAGVGEYEILMLVVLLSALSIPVFFRIRESAPEAGDKTSVFVHLRSYNWGRIFRGLIPMFIISVGAGLTIPFMNLYFHSIFALDSDRFAVMGSVAAVLVFLGGMLTPVLRRKLGYGGSIAITQFTAIFFLVFLASTEMYSEYGFALWFAAGAFIVRQPLMNMASPITSELVMKYVGPQNRELISAIESGLWNASWFVSAKIFQFLRASDLAYYKIFLITAVLYSVGTASYLFLVRDYKRQMEKTPDTKIPPAQPEAEEI
ncbi:MAG: MFS transporter [Candidatus Neomarinimicrobiota bacterium]|nr:MFS transporter [Candidatus Neomarinimicrobiota bacterium]MDD3966230.1 MFS transporter [Candidatus Neomarinimicrobiota bacterium]